MSSTCELEVPNYTVKTNDIHKFTRKCIIGHKNVVVSMDIAELYSSYKSAADKRTERQSDRHQGDTQVKKGVGKREKEEVEAGMKAKSGLRELG